MLTQSTASAQDQYGQPLDEVTERGLAIYDSRLKTLLELEHCGEVVAIHVDSGDYAVAPSSPDALRAMRRIRPSGLLFLYTIGPSTDYGLARRMTSLSAKAGSK